jgi:hypothetical protein
MTDEQRERQRQKQIATFLDGYFTDFPRQHRVLGEGWMWQWQERPTAKAIADDLIKFAEFRALRLGTWLGTETGQVIAEAVEIVSPPFYRQDEELLVEALKLAAAMQKSEGEAKAGAVALAAVVTAAGTGALLYFFGRGEAA